MQKKRINLQLAVISASSNESRWMSLKKSLLEELLAIFFFTLICYQWLLCQNGKSLRENVGQLNPRNQSFQV